MTDRQAYPQMRATRLMLHRRIKGIALEVLLNDLANPEKAYKHDRIIAELARRFLKPKHKVLLRDNKTYTVWSAKDDGYFYVKERQLPFKYSDVKWGDMRDDLVKWEIERQKTPEAMEELKMAHYITEEWFLGQKRQHWARYKRMKKYNAEYREAHKEKIKEQHMVAYQKRKAALNETRNEGSITND